MIVFFNGAYVPIEEARLSPDDRGFLFADAIYEVVRFHAGRPFHLPEHVERMREGLAAIRIDADPTFYADVSARLLAANRLEDADAIVYAQVSRGAAPRSHGFPPKGTPPTIYAFARPTDPLPDSAGGRAILLPDDRWSRCDIKTVMLLPNVLAYQHARDLGASDAILVRDGYVTEGTKANLFAVIGGVLRTAPNGRWILPGVTRGAAITAARALGISVEERAFTVEEFFAADEVFLASTTLWTYPLVEVDGRRIGSGAPGRVAPRIREALIREFTGGC